MVRRAFGILVVVSITAVPAWVGCGNESGSDEAAWGEYYAAQQRQQAKPIAARKLEPVKPVQPLKVQPARGPSLVKPMQVESDRGPSPFEPPDFTTTRVKPLDVNKLNFDVQSPQPQPAHPLGVRQANESWWRALFGGEE